MPDESYNPATAPPATRRDHLAVLALYLALALYLLAKVLPDFNGSVPGMGIANADAWQNVWNMWWGQYALFRNENPFTTPMLFHPAGVSLYIHPLNLSTTALVLPVYLAVGPVAAYNVAVLLGFVLTGYGTYLLALHVVGGRGVACFAGAAVTFSPFHISKLADGHLSWVTLQWIPFYMLCLLRALETRRWYFVLAAAVLLVLTAHTSWYHALFCLFFTGLLVLVRLPGALRSGTWRGQLGALLLVGALTGLLLAPVLVPTVQEYRSTLQPDATGWDRLVIAHSADALDILFPSYLHPLWGGLAEHLHNGMRPGIWGWNIGPGVGLLLLALIGSRAAWPQARPWLLISAGLFVLLLGPRLSLAGIATDLPLPYELLRDLPGIGTARRPNHLVVVLLPLLALLSAWGVRALLARGHRGRLIALLLLLLVGAEYIVLPLPALPHPIHPVFARLRGQPGAIFELPPGHRSALPMLSQTIHERPTVGGYLSRTPDIPHFVEHVPWMRELWQAEPAPADITPGSAGWAPDAFSFYAIQTLVVHRQHPDLAPGQAERLEALIAQRLPHSLASYADAAIAVYAVPPVAARPFLYLGGGWQQPEGQGARTWRWMDDHATVQLVNPTAHTRPVVLELAAESYQQPRPLTLTLQLATGAPTSSTPVPPPPGSLRLGSFGMPRAHRLLRLHLLLPPGEHTIHLVSRPAPAAPGRSRRFSLSFTRIDLAANP